MERNVWLPGNHGARVPCVNMPYVWPKDREAVVAEEHSTHLIYISLHRKAHWFPGSSLEPLHDLEGPTQSWPDLRRIRAEPHEGAREWSEKPPSGTKAPALTHWEEERI